MGKPPDVVPTGEAGPNVQKRAGDEAHRRESNELENLERHGDDWGRTQNVRAADSTI